MSFRVGQKIVCIVDDWSHPLAHLVAHLPRKDGIYHVRGYDPYPSNYYNHAYIWLVEVSNPIVSGMEPSFLADCFRPVVEKKTDISIFTAMLTPSGRKLETVMTDDPRLARSPGLESENPSRAGTPA